MTCPDKTNIRLIELREIGSTNDYLKANVQLIEVDQPVLVCTRHQPGGRGREQRTWISEDGCGVYCSLGMRLNLSGHLHLVSLATGIAVAETLDQFHPGAYLLKWPNDLLLAGKKIAGILIENVIEAEHIHSIIGIGININNEFMQFPQSLKGMVTSLKQQAGKSFSLEEIRCALVERVLAWIASLEAGAIGQVINRFNELSLPLKSRPISFHVNQRQVNGIYRGIDHDGAVEIEIDGGEIQRFYSGEIRV